MKVAIVGSRKFPQLQLVEWFIRDLPLGVTVISGGAEGVDRAAEEYAQRRGLETEIKLPDLVGAEGRGQFTERYYARNQKIVDACDLVVAFTEKDSGGTWDTIKRARKAGKPVKIIRPSAFFPQEEKSEKEKVKSDQSESDQAKPEQLSFDDAEGGGRPKFGAGPFALKRVSLGSYALRRKSYIDPEEWADIVAMKDTFPARLAEKMLPMFLEFFEKNNKFGVVHAISVPPRSKRNLEKEHVMDILSQRLAKKLSVEWARMFEPWEKSTRGRFAEHGKIEVTPGVEKYVGKVVWILDDISTTNFTLQSAVQGLMSLEIHAHGLAYVYMA